MESISREPVDVSNYDTSASLHPCKHTWPTVLVNIIRGTVRSFFKIYFNLQSAAVHINSKADCMELPSTTSLLPADLYHSRLKASSAYKSRQPEMHGMDIVVELYHAVVVRLKCRAYQLNMKSRRDCSPSGWYQRYKHIHYIMSYDGLRKYSLSLFWC